jgi:hypothetical protein
MDNNEYITTPVGRLVQGDAFVGSDKDSTGRKRVSRDNVPYTQWFVAIAVPKTAPDYPAFQARIGAIGQRDWPGGQFQRPDFAWKILDGDNPKHVEKVGFQGCWIIKASTGYAPKVYNNSTPIALLVDPNSIKRGYFVRLVLTCKGNGQADKPGVYLSHSVVQLMGYGEEIRGGPDANAILSQVPIHAPTGMSTVPIAGSNPAPHPAAQHTGFVNPAMPAQSQTPAAQHTGFVNPAMPAQSQTPAAQHTGFVNPAMPAQPQMPAAQHTGFVNPAMPAQPQIAAPFGVNPNEKVPF